MTTTTNVENLLHGGRTLVGYTCLLYTSRCV